MRVILELNEYQAKVLVNALDALTRLHCGQIGTALEDVWRRSARWTHADHGDIEDLRSLCRATALVFTGKPADTMSLCDPALPDEPRIAYDILQVVRNRVAWTKHPQGGAVVAFDEPSQIGPEPLPDCEVKS